MKPTTLVLATMCVLATARGVPAQTSDAEVKQDNTAAEKPAAQSKRLKIQVTGGEKNVPVADASVYLKYEEARVLRKDKKYALNVKTNREGTAHIPAAPMGRVLIQVVADGWKTYGRWYDITDVKQTLKIHLEKPPKWY